MSLTERKEKQTCLSFLCWKFLNTILPLSLDIFTFMVTTILIFQNDIKVYVMVVHLESINLISLIIQKIPNCFIPC